MSCPIRKNVRTIIHLIPGIMIQCVVISLYIYNVLLYIYIGVKDLTPPEPLGTVPEINTARAPRYVSGQYFFEYLVVVSLKKSKEGNYEPQIIYQFPKVSYDRGTKPHKE